MSDTTQTPLTTEEAAKHLRCSTRTVLRRFHAGQLAGIQPGGRTGPIVFLRADLDDFILRHRRPATAEMEAL